MPWPLPRWFAHRGGGSLAPENTLAGIRLAAGLGFKAVEFDVMLSGDGTPVLIHDETLERTTNGRGLVCDTPDAVLFALDAGQGERIPRFVEAAALCRQLGLLANVEIKPASGHEERTAEVVARLGAELWRGAEQLDDRAGVVDQRLFRGQIYVQLFGDRPCRSRQILDRCR